MKQKPALAVGQETAECGREATCPWNGEPEPGMIEAILNSLRENERPMCFRLGPGMGKWAQFHCGLNMNGLVETGGLGGW